MFRKLEWRCRALWRHLTLQAGKEKAHQRRDTLSVLIDESPDAILTRDKNRKILSWNKGAENMFGWPAAEVIGRRAVDIGFTTLRPEDIQTVEQTILQTGKWQAEIYYRHRDGRLIFGAATANAIRDADGNLTNIVFIIRDISARKRLEERLTNLNNDLENKVEQRTQDVYRNELLLRSLFEHSQEAISVTGADFIPIYRSPAFLRILGDISIRELSTFAHPEDLPALQQVRQTMLQNPGVAIQLEGRFRNTSGDYIWMEGTLTNLTHIKGIEGVVANVRDITARKLAMDAQEKLEQQRQRDWQEKQRDAQRLSRILDALPASIALLGPNGTIIGVNAWWRRFATENGLLCKDDCVGWNYLQVAMSSTGDDAADGHAVAAGIRRVLAGESTKFAYEYTCHAPSEQRWFRMVVTPLSGNGDGAVVMHHDISTLRLLEAERIRRIVDEEKIVAGAMLEAQEAERNFIGAELHDNIGQLLVGTLMTLALAKRDPAECTAQLQQAIELIHQTVNITRKMAHLLVTPDFAALSVTQLLQALSAGMLEKAGIQPQWDIGSFDESSLQDAQKLALYRIAQEQCTNILKYAEARNVKFTLSTLSADCTMIIADDGKGMDKHRQGNGIGLRNIRGRLITLGGSLQIQTADGAGFCLQISFPLAEK